MSIEQHTLEELWEIIAAKLAADKEPYAGLNAIYEIQLSDVDEGIYQLEFQDGSAMIHQTKVKEPNCVLKMKTKYFERFLFGNLNSTTAFMTGKVRINGNISLALTLENMLNKFNLSN